MRDIKFMGLCSISKEMVFGDLIHGVGSKYENIYILPNKTNLAYVKHCDPLDGVKIIPETLGQYTGIKDKTGKEIYEGHIVKDSEQTYIVRFGEQIEVDIEFIGFYFEHITCKEFNGAFSSFDSKVLEIIGNIYENPELIK